MRRQILDSDQRGILDIEDEKLRRMKLTEEKRTSFGTRFWTLSRACNLIVRAKFQ